MEKHWQLRWLILASYYFFPGISNAFGIQGGANIYNPFLLATRLKHLKRVLNISNAFETFETCFEYSQPVLNFNNVF